MPHIADETKVVLLETKRPIKEGDLCFLFAKGALEQYNQNPRWASIHKIRVALNHPYHSEWSHLIIQEYMNGWSKVDVEAAANLAFDEFYRVVGAKYEDGMIAQNGNAFKGAKIPSIAEDFVIEDGRFTETKVVESTVGFVAPKRGRPVGSKNKPVTEGVENA